MKQKRTYVTLLLVVALLALGIAYAALGQQALKVTTDVTTTVSGTMDVKITKVEGTEATTVGAIGDGLAATLDITGLKADGDTATATVTFTNNQSGVPANIAFKNISGTAVDANWLDVSVTMAQGADNVASGATTTATIVVELLKTPGTADDEAAASVEGLVVNFTADPVNQ